MITIALAEDHHLVRQGLRALLEADPDFSIVGEMADGLTVAETVERLRPDVLLLDLMLPGLSGLDVLRQIATRAPGTRAIILSMHADHAYVVEALRNGAAGYVVKAADAAELACAVREVAAGRRYLSPPLSGRIIEDYLEKVRTTAHDPYDLLTDREREVLHLILEGKTNAVIATRLSISPRTVESHRASLTRKLGVTTHVDLVLFAVRRGILPMK